MLNISTRQITYVVALTTLFLLASLLLGGRDVSAATADTYDPGPNDVAIFGPNAAIDAPIAHYVVRATGGDVDVIIIDACKDSTAGAWGLRVYTDGRTKEAKAGDRGDCEDGNSDGQANDLVIRDVPPNKQVRVTKIAGQGHQPFRIKARASSSNTQNVHISHLGNPNRFNSGFSDAEADSYGQTVWMGGTNTFRFTTPCDYNGDDIFFKWKDADNGVFGSPKAKFIEYDESGDPTGWTKTVKGAAIGGNGSKRWYKDFFIAGYQYDWEWSGTTGSNAVQHILPYESIPGQKCDPPEPPEPTAKCSQIKFTMPADGNTHRYRVYVNDNGTPGIPTDTNGDGDKYNDNVDYGGTAGSEDIITKDLIADNKVHPGTLTYTVVIYNGSTVSTGRLSEVTGNEGPCYTANCEVRITSNIPDSPDPNGVQAGQPFSVRVRTFNTSAETEPSNLGGNPLAVTLHKDGKWGNPDGEEFWGVAPARIYQSVAMNAWSGYRYFQLIAPNDRNTHPLRMYADYWGRFPMGPECSVNVNTYQRYDFDAAAGSSLDNAESPTNVNFTSSLTQRGVDVDDTSTRTFYKKRGGAVTPIPGFGPYNDGPRNFGNGNYNENYGVPPGSYVLGDSWCTSVYLSRGHGWRGPGAVNYINEGPTSASNCGSGESPSVINRPYFRAYGEDVVAGGGFGQNCSRTNSRILGFLSPLNKHNPGDNQSGSGSQLAAMALGSISGFTSASLRDNAPSATGARGLTFANTNPTSPDNTSDNPELGGNMHGNGWCMPDYYAATQFADADANKEPPTSSNVINTQTLSDGKQTVVTPAGGKLRILGPNAPIYNKKHTLFVNGDVFIRDNVMYNTDYSAGTQIIPSFTLVVKGNIYIDNDVTQLDGLYIAQPNDSQPNTTGRIYTCATENSGDAPVTAPPLIYSQCGADNNSSPPRQLMVNGAFIAQRVVLNRSGFSLRDSNFKEPANASKAAEIFNFSPEMYLSPPVFRPNSTSTSGDYQYISIMAPIL